MPPFPFNYKFIGNLLFDTSSIYKMTTFTSNKKHKQK